MDQKTPAEERQRRAGEGEGEFETIIPLPGEVAPPPKRDLFTLSPISKRRWRNFRANKRGYWSLWIFLALFFVSMFAEFLANDKPLIVSYKGEILYPVFVDYPEEKFGGFFAVTDYRSPFIQNEINANGWALWPPIRYSYRTANLDFPIDAMSKAIGETVGFPTAPNWLHLGALCKTPSADEKVQNYCSPWHWNWLGTDDQGRDVLARLIYGFRLSVLFGFALTLLSSAVGVTAGATQGYFGGRIDLFFQRFIEIWTSIPSLYLLLIISSVLVPGFFVLLGILLLFSWVALVGVVRAEFLRARNVGYVRAARALGVKNLTIMFRHLLPNAMVATLTFVPFVLNGSITTLTSLDFLGLGMPPGSPSLGELLAQGKNNLQAPWLGLTGFIVISLMLSLLIFVGEAVRDAFDPRKTFVSFDNKSRAPTAETHTEPAATEIETSGEPALLKVRNLHVEFRQGDSMVSAVNGVSFDIRQGETLALVGEFGSGKSVTALSILKLLPYPSAHHSAGSVTFAGKELLWADEKTLREVRGNRISMIFQEPMSSLNPLHTVERQVGEVLAVHRGMSGAAARARVLQLLEQVGIREPEERLNAYPHQLSGGQRQRVMIAMALANEPDILIADEPTTALDVTVQAQILQLLARLKSEQGLSMLFITHDLGIVRNFADRVCVMTDGEIVEQGSDGGGLRAPAACLHQAPSRRRAEGQAAGVASGRARHRARRRSEGLVPDPARPLPPHGRLHQGGGRRQRRGARGTDARRRGRVGLRQDDARPGASAPDLLRRAHRLPWTRHSGHALQGHARPSWRDAGGVPGPLRFLEPAHGDPRRRGGGSACARAAAFRGGARGTRGAGSSGSGDRPGEPLPLSARILRRSAPEDRYRARPGAAAALRDARRADLGARHERAGAGRRSPARAAGAAQPFLPLHQPRSEGRARARQRRHRHARRQGGGRRDGAGRLRQS